MLIGPRASVLIDELLDDDRTLLQFSKGCDHRQIIGVMANFTLWEVQLFVGPNLEECLSAALHFKVNYEAADQA